MVKKLLIAVAVLVLIVIIALVAVVMNIDGIAKGVLISSSEKATKSTTTVDSVHVGLLSGDVSVSDYELANPTGYADTHAIKFNTLGVNVDGRSIFTDTVVVDLIEIKDVDVNLEAKGLKTNLSAILENIQEFAGQGKTSPAPEPTTESKSSGKKFRVDKIVILNTIATVSLTPGPGLESIGDLTKTTITIPRIEYTPETDKAVLASDLIAEIIPQIIDAILAKSGGVLPPELQNILKGDLSSATAAINDKLDSVVDDAATKATDKVKEALGGKGGEDVDKVIDNAGEEVKKGLDNLFGN